MTIKPRGEMNEEEAKQARLKCNRRRILRDMGKPSLVPAGPAIEYLRRLHDEGGMSFRAIVEAAPGKICQSTLSDLHRGHRGASHDYHVIEKHPRSTHDLIMAVPMPVSPADGKAWVDLAGTQRRMRALACAGYSSSFIADELGHKCNSMVWRIMAGKATGGHRLTSVEAATRERMREVYGKLASVDPADMGVTRGWVSRTKNVAARRGFAPASCWDDDTIDDPDAFPEWTGECGTISGYYLHLKYDIQVKAYNEGATTGRSKQHRTVLCEPCAKARDVQGPLTGQLDKDEMRKMLILGWTHRRISAELGCSTMSVYREACQMKTEGWTPPRDRRKEI